MTIILKKAAIMYLNQIKGDKIWLQAGVLEVVDLKEAV